MAKWNKGKADPSKINGGNQFTSDDILAVDELNAMVNNSFYAVDFAEANTLSIGSVSSGETASATITGIAPNKVLNLVLPKGDKGDKGDVGDAGNLDTTLSVTSSNGVQNKVITEKINEIEARLSSLGFKQGVFTAISSGGGSLTFINDNNKITKIGKCAIGNFYLSYTGFANDLITIKVPDEFKPKNGSMFIAHKNNFLITGATQEEAFYGSIEPDGTITFTSDYISWSLRLENLGWEIG